MDTDENDKRNEDAPGKPLSFNDTVEHLSAGYANSQATVRFLDTKASAVVGIVPVVMGLLFVAVRWLTGLTPTTTATEIFGVRVVVIWFVASGFVVVAMLVAGAMALAGAFKCLIPRKPRDSKSSVLFPHRVSDTTEGADTMADRIRLFTGQPEKRDLLDDYEWQLDRMATIVGQKMSAVQSAVRCIRSFLVLAAVVAGFILAYGAATATNHLASRSETPTVSAGMAAEPQAPAKIAIDRAQLEELPAINDEIATTPPVSPTPHH